LTPYEKKRLRSKLKLLYAKLKALRTQLAAAASEDERTAITLQITKITAKLLRMKQRPVPLPRWLVEEVTRLKKKIKTLKTQRKAATTKAAALKLRARIHKLKHKLRFLMNRYRRHFYRKYGRRHRRHRGVYRHLSRGVVVPGEFTPKKNKVIAQHKHLRTNKWRGKITYAFWVKPMGVQRTWSNLFQKGSSPVARHPGAWFYPGSTRIHIRSGTRTPRTSRDINPYTNYGCDPSRPLTMGKWSFVAFTHRKGSLKVYVGTRKGKLRRACEIHNAPAPVPNFGSLRAGNPWDRTAKAVLADFRVYNRALSRRSLRAIQRKRVAKKYRHRRRHNKHKRHHKRRHHHRA